MSKIIFRCAIYTRKSTEEGLDQEFIRRQISPIQLVLKIGPANFNLIPGVQKIFGEVSAVVVIRLQIPNEMDAAAQATASIVQNAYRGRGRRPE